MRLSTICSTALLIFVVGCRDDPETVSIAGGYLYEGYDTTGTLVARGDIDFQESDGLLLGTRSIQSADTTQAAVLEVGEDSIRGERLDQRDFVMYLVNTPGPYLLLFGHVDGDTLRGDRREGSSTRVGPERMVGTFRAWRYVR